QPGAPLLKYCPGLTQPDFAKATCYNRETLPAGWSVPQQNGDSQQQGRPALAGWIPRRQIVNRLPPSFAGQYNRYSQRKPHFPETEHRRREKMGGCY
ncbi:hypothetical protein P7K49_040381, partial [Saguinus oedipus]